MKHSTDGDIVYRLNEVFERWRQCSQSLNFYHDHNNDDHDHHHDHHLLLPSLLLPLLFHLLILLLVVLLHLLVVLRPFSFVNLVQNLLLIRFLLHHLLQFSLSVSPSN